MSNVSCILMSSLYCKWSLEMMDEHLQNGKEMANTMMKINKKLEKMFNNVHVLFRLEIISRLF